MSKYLEKDETSFGDPNKDETEDSPLINPSHSQTLAHVSSDSKSSNSFNIKDLEQENELDTRRFEIQCELNMQGASDLVVDLFMSDITNKVFKENVLLAIALLEGGNTQVQKTIYNRLLNDKNAEKFFKTFHYRIEIAQKEIKNMNSFMSTDINDVSKIKAATNQQNQHLSIGHVGGSDDIGTADDHDSHLTKKYRSNSISNGSNYGIDQLNTATGAGNGTSPTNLPEDIAIMEIILRFLQLLCENHNHDLQNYLRVQPNNKTSYNLVCETLQFLDCICGSTTGGLGLLGLWINEHNVHLINQALESLTEYCQGPCHENQYSIINHESNGIDIVIALILNDIQPLSKNNVEMYLALKDNASKLLLAVMESNDDTSNAERILYNITPKALIDVITEAYEQGKEMDKEAEMVKLARKEERRESMAAKANESGVNNVSEATTLTSSLISEAEESEAATNSENTARHESVNKPSPQPAAEIPTTFFIDSPSSSSDVATENESGEESEGAPPREVGHNVYILAHKLAKYNKELSLLLKSKENEALCYYAAHTAQIEIIREDRAMEQIVFPVPTICEYLTQETKQRIFLTTEKDEQNSKITGFFEELDSMWNEMKWQRKLRQSKWLYWFSAHMSLWSDISFNFAVLINLLVAIFYPFDKAISGKNFSFLLVDI